MVAAAAASGERVAPDRSVARAAADDVQRAALVYNRDAKRGPNEHRSRRARKETVSHGCVRNA